MLEIVGYLQVIFWQIKQNVVKFEVSQTTKIKVTVTIKPSSSCGLGVVLFFLSWKRKRNEGGFSYPFVRVFCDAAVFEHNEGPL